jgi:hypothetical protein
MMSKFLITLTFDLDNVDDLATVLKIIDPPHIPWFTGTARIAIDPVATRVEEWLDEEK